MDVPGITQEPIDLSEICDNCGLKRGLHSEYDDQCSDEKGWIRDSYFYPKNSQCPECGCKLHQGRCPRCNNPND